MGIIGYGYWGPNLNRNFHELPDSDVVVVADLKDEQLKRVKIKYPQSSQNISCSSAIINCFFPWYCQPSLLKELIKLKAQVYKLKVSVNWNPKLLTTELPPPLKYKNISPEEFIISFRSELNLLSNR